MNDCKSDDPQLQRLFDRIRAVRKYVVEESLYKDFEEKLKQIRKEPSVKIIMRGKDESH